MHDHLVPLCELLLALDVLCGLGLVLLDLQEACKQALLCVFDRHRQCGLQTECRQRDTSQQHLGEEALAVPDARAQ